MRSATIAPDVCRCTHFFIDLIHPGKVLCFSSQVWFVVGFGLDGLGRRGGVGSARCGFFFLASFPSRDDSLTLNGSSGMDAVLGFVSSFMARLVPIQVRAGSAFFHHLFPIFCLGTVDTFHAQDILVFLFFAVRVDGWTCTCSTTFHRTTCLCRWRKALHQLSPQVFEILGPPQVLEPPRMEPKPWRGMVSMGFSSFLRSLPRMDPGRDAFHSLVHRLGRCYSHPHGRNDLLPPPPTHTHTRTTSDFKSQPRPDPTGDTNGYLADGWTSRQRWWRRGGGGRRIHPYVQRNATVGTNTTKRDIDNEWRNEKRQWKNQRMRA